MKPFPRPRLGQVKHQIVGAQTGDVSLRVETFERVVEIIGQEHFFQAADVQYLLFPIGLRHFGRRRIVQAFARLLETAPRPGTLIVAGGETLGAVCDALGATGLAATGLVGPGVPRSVLMGGRWDGAAVVSKSGAFGGDGLWRDLLARNGFITERQSA